MNSNLKRWLMLKGTRLVSKNSEGGLCPIFPPPTLGAYGPDRTVLYGNVMFLFTSTCSHIETLQFCAQKRRNKPGPGRHGRAAAV